MDATNTLPGFCHPHFVTKYPLASKSKIVPPQSTTLEMSQPDYNLKAALIQWRRETAVQKLGTAVIRTYGAKVFISDQIIECLVVCAHAHKLVGVEDITRETGWRKDQAEIYGSAILEIIHTHTPLPVPAVPPPTASVTGGVDNPSHAAQVIPDAGPTTLKAWTSKV
jgi:hypothetical protein